MTKPKLIGITCDEYKTNRFRKGLLQAGFTLEFDGKSGVKNVHLFRIAVDEKDWEEVVKKVDKTVKRIELGVKRSN